MSTVVAPRRSSPVVGARPLLRVSLAHDGRLLAPWVLIATALSATSVILFPIVFPSDQARAALSATVGANPALGLIFGPAHDLMTADGFNAWRTLALGGFLAGLGAIFAVTRATRAQEDSGQAELLASGVMGRSARLLTGLLVAFIGSLALGVVTGVVTALCGGGWNSSMLLAATFTATGWMFAAVAAVTAQLGSDARSANSMAVGTLGTLFLLTGFCYSVEAPSWTIWANPIGWMHETRPAAGDDWRPLLLAVAFTVAVSAVAFVLQARRDFGQGIVATRPGPARGATRSTLRLALRINQGAFVTWAVAFVAIGVVFGYFTTSVSDLFSTDSAITGVLASGATTTAEIGAAFISTILALVGIIACVPGVQVMLKVRSEELGDRVEPVLAGAVARPRYYGANVLVAFCFPAVLVLVAGTLVAARAGDAGLGMGFGDVLLQAVATIPAVWTVVALSVAVVGARPVAALAAWAGVLASFVLTLLGPTFGLDDWVLGIAPFWHVPDVGAGDPDWTGLGWISLVTLGFLLVGFAGFRRRDLAR